MHLPLFDALFENRSSKAELSKMRREQRGEKRSKVGKAGEEPAQTRDAQSQRCGLRAREVKPLGKTLGMAAHFYAERRDREEEEEEEDAPL